MSVVAFMELTGVFWPPIEVFGKRKRTMGFNVLMNASSSLCRSFNNSVSKFALLRMCDFRRGPLLGEESLGYVLSTLAKLNKYFLPKLFSDIHYGTLGLLAKWSAKPPTP